MNNEAEEILTKVAIDKLKGKTIKDVRYLTEKEAEEMGWCGGRSIVMIFNDNTFAFPSADTEGNGPGSLFLNEGQIPPI